MGIDGAAVMTAEESARFLSGVADLMADRDPSGTKTVREVLSAREVEGALRNAIGEERFLQVMADVRDLASLE